MLTKKIGHRLEKREKNSFYQEQEDDCYQMSLWANSPISLIESFGKIPFCKHENQTIQIENKYLTGLIHYQELEEGLWVICSEMSYMSNLTFKLVYDEVVPCNYYSLSYTIRENESFLNESKPKNFLFSYKSWSLLKPKSNTSIYHSKHTNECVVAVYFSQDWLGKNFKNGFPIIDNKVDDLMKSEQDYLVWPDYTKSAETFLEPVWSRINEKGGKGAVDILQLKIVTLQFIAVFLQMHRVGRDENQLVKISKSNRLKIHAIEKHLSEKIGGKFEGIDFLSRKFNICPTNLKTEFKLVFGKTIYQYFLEKKMFLAKDLLDNADIRIKEVAQKMGYENPGKFSIAYKKIFGFSPREHVKMR